MQFYQRLGICFLQADRQLHSGQITREEHRKLLSQLEDLYQFQKIKEEEASPPERMHSVFGGRNQYNYRLGGGRLERETLGKDREELPESDDSYVMEVARKLEYQKRMAGPRVIDPVEMEKKETSQETVAPVARDVDLRVFDPDFQKMVKQQKDEDMTAAGTEEKGQGGKAKVLAKDETGSQEVGTEKEKAAEKEEDLVKIAKKVDEKAESSNGPELVPMETDLVSSPSTGKDEKDGKDTLQVTKDSEPIQISPLSPPPEDRDERLTAVIGEKPQDEEETTSDVKDGQSKGVDEGKSMVAPVNNSSNEEKKNQKASKDVDDRVEMEVGDVDERIGVVKKDIDEREAKPKDVDQRGGEKEDVDERQLKHKESEKEENEEKHLDNRTMEIKDIDERTIGETQVAENLNVKSQKVEKGENEISKVSMDIDEKLPQGPVQKQTLNKEETKNSESALQGDVDQRIVAKKDTKDDEKVKVDKEEPPGKVTVAAGSTKKLKSAREKKKRKAKQVKGASKKKVADEKEKTESVEKEKDEMPAEDDLLPAAFRDEVDPKKVKKGALVDQDLRDKDLRNIHRPPERELLRARSWSDVPTNFFDAEGKRGADVQEVRHDVDLRSMRDPR